MSQLIFPNTIDPGTDMSAPEVQSNFDAIKYVINGNLQGGDSADGNVKLHGLGVREIDPVTARYLGQTDVVQQGVLTGLAVTPGAGITVNIANGRAFITDDGSVHSAGTLLPSTLGIPATLTLSSNSSGLPRVDQIVLTLISMDAGTVSVIPGTPTSGATLDNRNGAAALPFRSIRLADVLVPNAFVGPFVLGTHIRDRRPWAKGAWVYGRTASGATYTTSVSTSSAIDSMNFRQRLEVQSGLVEVIFSGGNLSSTVSNTQVTFDFMVDGVLSERYYQVIAASSVANVFGIRAILPVTPGSHLFEPWWWVGVNNASIVRTVGNAVTFVVREVPAVNGNGTA